MFGSNLCLAALAAGASAIVLPPFMDSSYAVKETHPVPSGWTKVMPAHKNEVIHLQIGLKQGTEGEIEKHLIEISDPAHHRYGQHLTEEEVHALTRPSEETINTVHSWLASHSIEDIKFSNAQDWVHISVPIEVAERLLQTEYHYFEHEEGDVLLRAPEWSLPASLHEHIDLVQPTTSFFRTIKNAKVSAPLVDAVTMPVEEFAAHLNSPPTSEALGGVCNITFTTPKCLRTLYGTIDYVPQATDKNSVGLNNYLNETNKRSDVLQFLQQFRPDAAAAANQFKIVTIANGNNDQGPYTPAQIAAGKNIEGNLDAETILGISYPTPLTAFNTGGSPPFIPSKSTPTDTNEPYLTWLNYAINAKSLPLSISSSYGDDEQTVPFSYAKRACAGFATLGARGISLLVSSGDAGVGSSGTCFINGTRKFVPDFPTSCPWVTSVGATKAFAPEVAVSRFASGAGFSNYFAQPSYQSKVVNAYVAALNGKYDGLYNKSGRAYPDVAAQGNHDVIVWAGNVTTVGGTSASSPAFAAVIALVNDALLAKGKKPLGFLNPFIYSTGYTALTDVTGGSSFGCNTTGFPATKGWDPVTGFGTPNFPKLVSAAMAAQS